jgi:MoxR-like ATPase
MEIKEQIKELLKELNKEVYEKEEVISLALLSAIAGESILLLGAPGVAKSLIARRLKFAFRDATSFEYLMNRFSTPDEIFGPVSISKLKDEDKYERIVKNYLPSAQVVFLDEIWKAGPSIQNALLTVLNEKIYRNGDKEMSVPIKALISASNELPAKGEGLEALWDRFLVRYVVHGVQNKEQFNEMISKSLKSYEDNITETLKISDDQYKDWSNLIDEVKIPENVFNIIHIIRNDINLYNTSRDSQVIYISDRRWKKIIRLLRTSAFLNGRESVDLMDCFLIQHCIWNEPKQKETISQFVKDAVQKYGYKLSLDTVSINKEIDDFKREVQEETIHIKDTREEKLVTKDGTYYIIENWPRQNNLLHISDYKRLTNANSNLSIPLYQEVVNYTLTQIQQSYGLYSLRKGNSKNSIFINNQEYSLKTEIKGSKVRLSKKPHKATEDYWDKKKKEISWEIAKLKKELENYQNTDLKHIRVNLFVNPSLAEFVEKNIQETNKELEKYKLDLRQIQHSYKNLKDDQLIERIS